MPWSLEQDGLGEEYLSWHAGALSECRRAILQMTHLAASGHPGGSLSSLDLYLVLYSHARIDRRQPWASDRDRIVVSHGHTSPAVYAVLSHLGFFPRDEVIATFRRTANRFEGHIEREVPGVEWTTGNLGQGLSAACGMALALRLKGIGARVFVPMGDGEQQKGQIAEARRFARKYGLSNITAIVDRNRLQIGGDTAEIMPQEIAAGWAADGWRVAEIDGHEPQAIYGALRGAILDDEHPHVIIARTIMGNGISFMENRAEYHGRALSSEEYARAAEESGEEPRLWSLEQLREKAASPPPSSLPPLPEAYPRLTPGEPRTYAPEQRTDNRSAFGQALLDVAEANARGDDCPMAVFDCDLEGSVKTGGFRRRFPDRFFEGGIQEHSTAATAGALSAEGIVTVFADFGVFGIAETYNQHRLTDINHGHLKIACTHVGLDVGEDGKTHQCIDYVGVMRNLFGARIIVPADPNQTDRAVRVMLMEPGMFLIAMGRSKLPVIVREDGAPFFAGDYRFEMGCGDWIREGAGGAVVVTGTPTARALEAVDSLRAEGLDIALAHLATPAEIDVVFVDEIARHPFLATVEDHSVRTGLGASLAEALFARGHALPHLRIGIERYAPSGTSEELYRSAGMDTEELRRRIGAFAKGGGR
ncbi:MAG: transketolase [Planctomycetota bacterium]